MILEEQPAKVAEAVKLFLQGLGKTNRKSTLFRKLIWIFFLQVTPQSEEFKLDPYL